MIRVFTRVFAVCLLLAGHVPLQALARATRCEMACCRKVQNSGCHRSHTHSGPAWQVNPCGSSCGNVQLGMTPVATVAPAAQGLPALDWAPQSVIARADSGAHHWIAFAQFQRPPPPSLQ